MNRSEPTIHIMIADDHAIFRDGLMTMLKKERAFSIIGDFENGADLLQGVSVQEPDIILMDINMPVLDGIEATKKINEQYPNIGVIALTMFDNDDTVLDILHAGARGYLLKNSDREEIIEAIYQVRNNQTYYCKNMVSKIGVLIKRNKSQIAGITLKPVFTERELEIIKLICHEKSAKEIAELLHVSFRTIEGHKQNIQSKLDVKNTIGIVIYAIKNKLFMLDDE